MVEHKGIAQKPFFKQLVWNTNMLGAVFTVASRKLIWSKLLGHFGAIVKLSLQLIPGWATPILYAGILRFNSHLGFALNI